MGLLSCARNTGDIHLAAIETFLSQDAGSVTKARPRMEPEHELPSSLQRTVVSTILTMWDRDGSLVQNKDFGAW